MFIIFGLTNGKPKPLGETDLKKCSRCEHEKRHLLIEASTYFTLFFIPIIPIKKKKMIICPVCGEAEEASQIAASVPQREEEAHSYQKKLIQLKNELNSGTIDDNEYKRSKNILDFDYKR